MGKPRNRREVLWEQEDVKITAKITMEFSF